ncbi:MAG: response regulator [Candidatus Eisenbacteria bacterium]|nr:response regulator [Candidatus Eisenbacteria bacterium]
MKRPRILIVDSEVYIVHILEFSLAIEGYDVVTATDADGALQRAEEEHPDLIVLDAALACDPDCEFVQQLRDDERLAGTPLIFLYAQKSDLELNEDLRLGAYAHIPKPFSPQRLIEEIRAGLAADQSPGGRAVGM